VQEDLQVLTRLAGLAHRRPGRVLVAALLFAVVAAVFGGPVTGLLHSGGNDVASAESSQANQRLLSASGVDPNSGFVLVVRAGTTDPAVLAQLSRHLHRAVDSARLNRSAIAKSYRDYVTTGDPAYRSTSGRDFTAVVSTGDLSATGKEATAVLQQRIGADRLLAGRVMLGGATPTDVQLGNQASADLARAEEIAFPVLFVVLYFVFRRTSPLREWRRTRSAGVAARALGRGLTAAALPLIVGVLTILATFLGLRVVNSFTGLSVFALNLSTGLGLGLSIDYSLLLLSRYREEARAGGAGVAALRRTLTTAGRTVAFSSLTVAAAMASLLVFPSQFLYSTGAGGIIVALSAAIVSLTVLPAILAVLGRHLTSGTARTADTAHGPWFRVAQFVMRRPLRIAVITGALMIALGLPFLGIKFTGVDAGVLPASASSRQVADTLNTAFPKNPSAPAQIIVAAPPGAGSQLSAYAAAIARAPGVTSVSSPRPVGSYTWEIDAVIPGDRISRAAQDAVIAIRAVPSSYPRYVTGAAAEFLDRQSALASHLPLAVAILAIVTLAILFVMTGSVILPLKAVVMNILTISAAFGILVLIFQDGRLQGLLGYTSQGALDSTTPILLFATAFGLSTDYGVFLLSRITEGHHRGLSTRDAVALGLQRTGRIVTSAALLLVIAIGAFGASSLIFIKEYGVGTAAAIAIDAIMVRALLVPSLMALLGKWNWWAPRPLRRLHHRAAPMAEPDIHPSHAQIGHREQLPGRSREEQLEEHLT